MPVHAELGADEGLHVGGPAEARRIHDALDLAVGRGHRIDLDARHLVVPGALDGAKACRGRLRDSRRPGRWRLPTLGLRLAPACALFH